MWATLQTLLVALSAVNLVGLVASSTMILFGLVASSTTIRLLCCEPQVASRRGYQVDWPAARAFGSHLLRLVLRG